MKQPTVIITGAASGIGKATAIRFAAEGYLVCALDIQGNKLQELQNVLTPGNHLFITGSYAEDTTIQECENAIRKHWGTVQVLVNCAGLSAKTDALQMPISEWRNIFDCMINVENPLNVTTLIRSKLTTPIRSKQTRQIRFKLTTP